MLIVHPVVMNLASVLRPEHVYTTSVIERLLVIMDTIEADDILPCVGLVPRLVTAPSPPDADRDISVAFGPATANASFQRHALINYASKSAVSTFPLVSARRLSLILTQKVTTS